MSPDRGRKVTGIRPSRQRFCSIFHPDGSKISRFSKYFGVCLPSFKIIALATLTLISQKGGVGKSTIAVNLSYSLARRGWQVLLVDADLQGGVGFSLTEKSKDAVGFYDLLFDDGSLSVEDAIIDTKQAGLSLLTKGSKGVADRFISGQWGQESLSERIGGLEHRLADQGFDLIIFDGPCGINPVSMALSVVSDSLLVPQQPSPLCLRSLPQILRMVAGARSAERGDPKRVPNLAGFVLSMADPDDPSNLDDQREFRDLLPVEMVLETVIPIQRDFLAASRIGVPVAMLRDRPSASSLIFDQLAAELEPRLNLLEEETFSETQGNYARLVD